MKDKNTTKDGVSFLSACTGHDNCYDKCAQSYTAKSEKAICDANLMIDLLKACTSASLSSKQQKKCIRQAAKIYWGVQTYPAKQHYIKAQLDFCECTCCP